MKRIGVATIIVSLALALGLSGCGNSGSDKESAKATPFNLSFCQGAIETEGTMPAEFKMYTKADEVAAATEAVEKDEEYNPEYKFKSSSSEYAIVSPDCSLEFSAISIGGDFASYKQSHDSDPAGAELYPILKKDFQIDGRDAFIFKFENTEFIVGIDISDFSPIRCYNIQVNVPEEKAFESTEEMIKYVEEDANFNAILDSLKITVK